MLKADADAAVAALQAEKKALSEAELKTRGPALDGAITDLKAAFHENYAYLHDESTAGAFPYRSPAGNKVLACIGFDTWFKWKWTHIRNLQSAAGMGLRNEDDNVYRAEQRRA